MSIIIKLILFFTRRFVSAFRASGLALISSQIRGLEKNPYLVIFVTAVIIFQFCSCSHVPKPPDSVKNISELEDFLGKVVDSGTPPGMSLVVVKDDKIIYGKGFGWADLPRKIQASSETVYHWLSITKIATAIAILQLQEKGLLNINDPVTKYLSFFNVVYPSDTSREVTILNLLNHSSGLPDPSGFRLMNWIHHEGTPPVNQTEMIKRVLPDYSTLKFEPGKDYYYTNIGYMVLGGIIEKITGVTYEDYIRENILKPLEMNHTDFVYTREMESDEAAGEHRLFSGLGLLMPILVGSYIREYESGGIWFERVYTDQTPSTGLIGSASDAARLVIAYLNKGELNGQRILSQESINAMSHTGQINLKDEDSLNYSRQGIGWQIYSKSGRWVVTHDGGGPGFSTKIQLYPDENLGIILFSNNASCELWRIINLAGSLEW